MPVLPAAEAYRDGTITDLPRLVAGASVFVRSVSGILPCRWLPDFFKNTRLQGVRRFFSPRPPLPSQSRPLSTELQKECSGCWRAPHPAIEWAPRQAYPDEMRVPGISNALGRSCAAVVCAALVANSPLNTVLEASTYQPSPEVQQLRFVDVDANNADTQLIFPSELLAAANAPAKPLTPAQRAERAEKEKAAKAAEPTKTAAPPSKVAQSKTEAPKAVVKEEPAKKAAAPSRAERAKAAQTKKADDFWGVEAKAEAAKAAPPAQAERPNPAPKAEKAAEERAMRQARADQEKAAAKATKDAASAKAAAPKAEAPKTDSPKAVKAEPVKGAAASKGEDKAAKEATYNAKKEADAKVRAERDVQAQAKKEADAKAILTPNKHTHYPPHPPPTPSSPGPDVSRRGPRGTPKLRRRRRQTPSRGPIRPPSRNRPRPRTTHRRPPRKRQTQR